MSATMQALLKRRAVPVSLPNGETVHVRPLTHREAIEAESLTDPNAKAFYYLGSGLVEADGSQAVTRPDGTGAQAFAALAEQSLDGIPLDLVQPIAQAIMSASRPPDPQAVAKNLPATPPPASP